MLQQCISHLSPLKFGGSLEFSPFLPASKDSSRVQYDLFDCNLNNLTNLLNSNVLLFLKNVTENHGLHQLVYSYLTFRSKPYESESLNIIKVLAKVDLEKTVHVDDIGEDLRYATKLLSLDRLIFALFVRIASPDREYRKFHCYLPKEKVSNYSSSTFGSSIKDNDVDEEYRSILDNLSIARLPYLLDLCGIAGDSNISSCKYLLKHLCDKRPALKKEIMQSVLESDKAVKEILQSIWNLYSVAYREIQKNNGSKTKKDGSSSLMGHKKQLKELLFATSFSADIAFSINSLFQSLPTEWLLEESPVYFANNLTVKCGLILWQMVQGLYEVALPLLINLLQQERNSKTAATDENLSDIERGLAVVQQCCVSLALRILFIAGTTGAKHCAKADQQQQQSLDTHLSWPEVFSTRLDLTVLLVGQRVDETKLRLGGFVSDLAVLSERQKSPLLADPEMCVESSPFLSYRGGVFEYLISKSLGDDEDILQSYMMSLKLDDHRPRQAKRGADTSPFSASAKEIASSEVPHESNSIVSLSDQISSIKSIFPDYGDGFIEACLAVYRHRVEDVIDALLSDNLHPRLKTLDRRMAKVWQGKNSASSVPARSNILVAQAPAADLRYEAFLDASVDSNKEFMARQKELVRLIEERQKRDADIINKEYDDDYDDQFDDVIQKRDFSHPTEIASSETATGAEPSANTNKANKANKAGESVTITGRAAEKSRDWRQEMEDMRRFNTLLRAEEAEIKFWEDMRNTNHSSKVASGRDSWKQSLDGDSEAGIEAGTGAGTAIATETSANRNASLRQELPKQGKHNNNNSAQKRDKVDLRGDSNHRSVQQNQQAARRAPSSDDAGARGDQSKETERAGSDKKPRTKTFDKHRQKDRALKKVGGFA